MKKIKVLIVDDSALVRQVLTEILDKEQYFEVVGTAQDPYIARDKVKELKPDVITLDVEMPRMDGVTFLANLMRLHPLPVVMISSLTEKGADITLQALELGAVDFVSKPKLSVAQGLEEYAEDIRAKVKAAAAVDVHPISERIAHRHSKARDKKVASKLSADAVLTKGRRTRNFKTTDKIIAIGASTGGTEAIREVLEAMPADAPAIVITQHIPAAFSEPFAKRMNNNSAMTVYHAKDGDQILPGHVYIAPGDQHMVIERSGARYLCRLNNGPPVNRHKPSVDVMFRSVAQNVGPNAIGVLLTGMGDDGAQGLLELKEAGARTIIQDEKSSVVWGMPGEAAKLGAADAELPLTHIAGKLTSLVSDKAS